MANDIDNFEYAARNKLRFPNPRGNAPLCVEDLYSLPVTGTVSLKAVGSVLYNELKQSTDDFMGTTTPDKSTTVALEIVKHIIAQKQEAAAIKGLAAARAAERHRIEEVLARKKEESLLASDVSVLEARLAELRLQDPQT